jgi:hypothetical protein
MIDDITITLDEGQRQATLLALALLCLQRPGWDFMLGEIADKLNGREMWKEFMHLNADVVKPL